MKLDQAVIVTGAARGIGREIASAYAREGAAVMLADVLDEEGEAAAAELRSHGCRALFQHTDVRVPRDVSILVARTVEQFGRLDVLVNNAGVSRMKSLFDLSIEEWDDVLNINLRGYFLCAREAAAQMMQRGGAIVMISSTRALMSEPNGEAYAASKGGVNALGHALAVSLAEYRIRVNVISPGWIETGDYSKLRECDHEQHPAKRVGRPADIARACLYLTNPENDFLTGINLVVDGGMTRKMIYEE